MSEEAKTELLSNKLIYQGGNGNWKLAPVIIVKDIVKALDVLSNRSVRIKCGIHPKNEFLFPSTQGILDHVLGYHCTRTVTIQAGVSKNLAATKMRHRASTLFAEMEMPNDQREFFSVKWGTAQK